MVSISHALAQVKDDLPRWIAPHLDEALAQQKNFTWRDRLLNPLTTIGLFLTQIMHGSAVSSPSNGNTAINHLRHLSEITFSATAYCNARIRLPLALLQRVSENVGRALRSDSAVDDACRWRGHRVWLGDGGSFSMPDTPALQEHFGQPGQQKAGCGFPTATLLMLCNAAGFIAKTLALPLRTHEASQLSKLHDQLEPGDVLVYDRAGCSYAHLALLFMRNLHAIVRMHQKQIVSFRSGRKHARQCRKGQRAGKPKSQWIKRLGKCDQLVRWFKPTQRPQWMTPEEYDALPDALELRELRYAARRKGFRSQTITLVTTLLDPEQYPASELAERYLGRWAIELNMRHLKQTMKMDVLKCKTVDGVLKELAMFVLVYNLVRLVMLGAAQRQKAPPDRISFIDALRWLCATRDANELIDLIVNPQRIDRVEPRVIKRRSKPYPLMTKPRGELRQALLSGGVKA